MPDSSDAPTSQRCSDAVVSRVGLGQGLERRLLSFAGRGDLVSNIEEGPCRA